MNLDQIKEIRDTIPGIISEYYPVQVWSLYELGGYQNWVYQISCEDRQMVVRVTPAAHRRFSHLQSEIALVNALHRRGVPVAAPVQHPRVPVIRRVKLRKGTYYLSTFEKAPGLTWREVPKRDAIFLDAGRVLARIHTETANISHTLARPSWEENHYLRAARRAIPCDRRWVLHKMIDHIGRLRELPHGQSEYGLIHGDYQFSNMLYSSGGVTVIDFDEAEYNWYAYDLAVYLFYILLGSDPGDMDLAAGGRIWRRFLEGYSAERRLPDALFERLPDFLRLREYKLYSSIFCSLGIRPLGAWQSSFLWNTEQRLKSDRPFIDVERLRQGQSPPL